MCSYALLIARVASSPERCTVFSIRTIVLYVCVAQEGQTTSILYLCFFLLFLTLLKILKRSFRVLLLLFHLCISS